MGIESIKRWQWMLMSLLIGWVIGFVWNKLDDGTNTSGVETINRQETFEQDIVAESALSDGRTRRHFDNLVVERIRSTDPEDEGKVAYRITGSHRVLMPKYINGKEKWPWMEQIYIAPQPYHPIRKPKVSGEVKPGALERLADLLRLKEPEPQDSVITYLRQMSASPAAVQFTYKWWNQPRIRYAGWMAGCFVAIGLIWPTIVNVILFGTFTRPPEEKGESLRKVKNRAAAEAKPKSLVTQQDMEELKALEAELEAKLAKDAKPRAASPVEAGPAAPAPIKPLGGGDSEPAKVPEESHEQKAFAAKQDDFYPTERASKPKKPGA